MCHSLSRSHDNLFKDNNKTVIVNTVQYLQLFGIRKEMVIIMKQMKELIKDVCVYIISLISIAVFFGEIFSWMLYI